MNPAIALGRATPASPDIVILDETPEPKSVIVDATTTIQTKEEKEQAKAQYEQFCQNASSGIQLSQDHQQAQALLDELFVVMTKENSFSENFMELFFDSEKLTSLQENMVQFESTLHPEAFALLQHVTTLLIPRVKDLCKNQPASELFGLLDDTDQRFSLLIKQTFTKTIDTVLEGFKSIAPFYLKSLLPSKEKEVEPAIEKDEAPAEQPVIHKDLPEEESSIENPPAEDPQRRTMDEVLNLPGLVKELTDLQEDQEVLPIIKESLDQYEQGLPEELQGLFRKLTENLSGEVQQKLTALGTDVSVETIETFIRQILASKMKDLVQSLPLAAPQVPVEQEIVLGDEEKKSAENIIHVITDIQRTLLEKDVLKFLAIMTLEEGKREEAVRGSFEESVATKILAFLNLGRGLSEDVDHDKIIGHTLKTVNALNLA